MAKKGSQKSKSVKSKKNVKTVKTIGKKKTKPTVEDLKKAREGLNDFANDFVKTVEENKVREDIAFVERLRRDTEDIPLGNKGFCGERWAAQKEEGLMKDGDVGLLEKKIGGNKDDTLVGSFVSYYTKIITMKNNHIKMLNEEVDILRRKAQLLEARVNENEGVVENVVLSKMRRKS